VTHGTAPGSPAGHAEQANPVANHRSEETTVRHAVITVQLIHQARTAGTEGDDRLPRPPRPDAPADPTPAPGAPRRLATLARRARALVARTT
jgi:hypothetical protein